MRTSIEVWLLKITWLGAGSLIMSSWSRSVGAEDVEPRDDKTNSVGLARANSNATPLHTTRAQIAAEGSLEGRQCRVESRAVVTYFLQDTGCQAQPPKGVSWVRNPSNGRVDSQQISLEHDARCCSSWPSRPALTGRNERKLDLFFRLSGMRDNTTVKLAFFSGWEADIDTTVDNGCTGSRRMRI